MKRHRSVLSRLERIKLLKERGLLMENASVLGLPKVKHLKIRVRKEKAAGPATAEGAAAPGTAAAAPAAGGAKAAPAKAAPSKAGAPQAEAAAGKKKE